MSHSSSALRSETTVRKPGILGIGAPPWPCSPLGPPLQVRIWEIPEGGLKRNMTEALLELHGHSRRVGLVEWHPTTNNILFSAGYDYKVHTPGPTGHLPGEAQGMRSGGRVPGALVRSAVTS